MLGVDVAGNLRVDRISMLGAWQGSGPRRPISSSTVRRPSRTSLYTPSYGGTTPTGNGVFEAVLAVPVRDAER